MHIIFRMIIFHQLYEIYYYYITHVSMKSIMLSQKNNTFIKFFILVWKNIYEEQKPVTINIHFK